MKNFIYENRAKVYFGEGVVSNLGKEVSRFGKKALVVYGGGSIKRNGLYDLVIKSLSENNIEIFELSGVEPNPRHTTMNKGAKLCKENSIDVVIPVGGGSTIDCAKGIAASALYENDGWDLVKNHVWITKALPIVAVLTNAATGSEMNAWAVISNMDTNEKLGLGGSELIPYVAFEDPTYSMTLPVYQTACGAFDIFNHVLDNYYLAGDSTFDLILEFQEAVMRTVVKWAPVAMKEPNNYEARANLMWASSMALNGILDAGSAHASACHMMEHELSAFYDITHGHGLAILTPRWLEYILDDNTCKPIYRLGVKVFNVEEGLDLVVGAKLAIEEVKKFCFKTLGLKSQLSDLGFDDKHIDEMSHHACFGGILDGLHPLTPKDVKEIYKKCL